MLCQLTRRFSSNFGGRTVASGFGTIRFTDGKRKDKVNDEQLDSSIAPRRSKFKTPFKFLVGAVAGAGVLYGFLKRSQSDTITWVVERTSPAVVNITTKTVHPFYHTLSTSSWSGFIVDSNGGVLTKAYVVANCSQVDVIFSDGRVLPGRVEYVDESRDLAKITIDADNLPSLKMSTKKCSPGEVVIAIGLTSNLSETVAVETCHASINVLNQDTFDRTSTTFRLLLLQMQAVRVYLW